MAAQQFKITKDQLIDLVQTYKARTYNEDLLCLENNYQGGESIPQLLNVDIEKGLTGQDFPERTEAFGNNYRPPITAKPFCRILYEALDDFMLKVLLVCAAFSITFDMILATPHEREHAWIEGTAIFVAVLVVSGVSSLVDW